MRKPKPLRPGDTIRVVSPASPLSEASMTAMDELLKSEGYRVQYGKNVLVSEHYLAGSDAARAEDLMEAFCDPEVDAVLCSRGGYGSARLMPLLDLDAIAASDKLLLGYSDITTVHLALLRRGLACVYSPMSITFSVDRDEWVYDSFKSAIKGGNPIPEAAPKGDCLTPGIAEGEVTGGCMCLLTDSLATPDALDAKGKILLIEDVDENPHRIDAMLTHLLLSGILPSAAGVVIGEMTNTDERSDPVIGARPWRDIVRDRVQPLGIPAIIDFPFGHAKRGMLTLPLGLRARLDAAKGTLTYLETLCD